MFPLFCRASCIASSPMPDPLQAWEIQIPLVTLVMVGGIGAAAYIGSDASGGRFCLMFLGDESACAFAASVFLGSSCTIAGGGL